MHAQTQHKSHKKLFLSVGVLLAVISTVFLGRHKLVDALLNQIDKVLYG